MDGERWRDASRRGSAQHTGEVRATTTKPNARRCAQLQGRFFAVGSTRIFFFFFLFFFFEREREAFRSGVVLQPGPKGPELTYSAQSNMVTSGPYLHAFREKEAKSAHQHA